MEDKCFYFYFIYLNFIFIINKIELKNFLSESRKVKMTEYTRSTQSTSVTVNNTTVQYKENVQYFGMNLDVKSR